MQGVFLFILFVPVHSNYMILNLPHNKRVSALREICIDLILFSSLDILHFLRPIFHPYNCHNETLQ